MAMVDVDGSSHLSADSQPKSVGLICGLAATRRSVCIHQMNRVNFHNGFGRDDSIIIIMYTVMFISILVTAILHVKCTRLLYSKEIKIAAHHLHDVVL